MTHPDNTAADRAQLVTLDRIVDACAQKGIGLSVDDPSGRVAHGEHANLKFMIVLLESVFIARADSQTDTPVDSHEPTLYLAANEVNSTLLGARAVISNRDSHLVVRTESEVSIAAGMTDAQLRSAAFEAVETVVNANSAMIVLAEQIESQIEGQMGAAEAEGGEV